MQIDNGIPILDFYGSENDVELIHLEKMLIKFAQVEDVRLAIREHLKLIDLAELSRDDLKEYLLSGKSLEDKEHKFVRKGSS